MRNFDFEAPTKIAFGRGRIAALDDLVPRAARVLVTLGGGSARRNGVLDQVMAALGGGDTGGGGRHVEVFEGIEPNPTYETLMGAVPRCREGGFDLLLAVGGGSVVDGTKFIAAAARYEGEDPWDLLVAGAPVRDAIPLGCVLTLPATGSEANVNAVITRASVQQKRYFGSPLVRPRFAVLDPETTFTLPPRQTANGIVDAYVHVLEQYATFDVNTPLQDRQAEAVLLTLREEGPKVLAQPRDYDARANVMWAATQALNGLLSCGTVGDWGTHLIGHELTALWGIDHGRTLAVVLPGLWRYQAHNKRAKLLQYGARVLGITQGSEDERVTRAIDETAAFFRRLGVDTDPAAYGLGDAEFELVAERLRQRGVRFGERGQLTADDVVDILRRCA